MDLLANLIDREEARDKIQQAGLDTKVGFFPFTESSLDSFCEYIRENPERALPRAIIESINECAVSAFRAEDALIDDNRVEAMRR